MKPMIRLRVRFAALGVLGLVAMWTIVSISVKERSRPGLEETLIDPVDARAQKLLCGPRNLCIALSRLGIPTRLEALTKDVRLTERGVAMDELVRLTASMAQVNAKRTLLTWDDLVALNGTAILLVDDRHFIVADPREKEKSPRNEERRIRVYDQGKPSRWLTRTELATIWKGDTIVLRRKPGRSGEGPRLVWEHCLIDAGYFKRDETAHYQFNFRNVGNTTLQIKSIKKSCNCAGYEVSDRRIPPGQSGWIKSTAKLDRRRGKFRSFLLVRTNDLYSPDTVLTTEAFVYNDHVLSHDGAYFGQIPQGIIRSLEIFVHDPGEENLQVLDVQIELSTGQGQSEHIQPLLESIPVEEGSKYVGTMGVYPVKVGDYLIRPMITVDNDCPVGPFTGKIFITTNLKSPLDHIEMPLDGNIVSDVHSCPTAVMLILGPNGHTQETIHLESLANRQFEVQRVWTDTNAPISIKLLSKGKGKPCYEIRSLPATVDFTERLVQTAVHFRFNEGSVLHVPVTIYRK